MKYLSKKISLFLVTAIISQCICLFCPISVNATSSIRVQMYNANTASPITAIQPFFRIINSSSSSIDLANLKIRYYYTIDSSATQNFWCDWATVGAANVTGSFVTITNSSGTADCYLEIGFTSGSLAANGSTDVQIRFAKSDNTSYNQANDYSFNPIGTTYADCAKVTGYLSGSLVWGTAPAAPSPSPSPSPTGRKFLVVVSKPLYDYGYGEVASTLNVYMNDLVAEGWLPQLITVDNTLSTSPQYTCINATALKERIRTFYNDGYEGFVLIGSHPSIPTAFWTYDAGSTNLPSDLFYADMSNWGSLNSEGAFVPYSPNPSNDVLSGFAPDMIYGRISSGSITDSDAQEAVYVKSYLDKIHNYRVHGSNLDTESQKRSLVFQDCDDYKQDKSVTTFLRRITPQVYSIFDDSLTTPDRIEQELEKGYKFYQQTIHSSNDFHQVHIWNGYNMGYSDYTYNRILTNPVVPKVNFMQLSSCSACQYNAIENGIIVEKNNIGAAYLFTNNYVLNVTGSTGGWGYGYNEEFYTKLAGGTPVGQAYKDYMTGIINNYTEVGCPKGILLGDPTLKYTTTVNNITPCITTNLAGGTGEPRLVLYSGVPFTMQATDPDLTTNGRNDSIVIELSGNDTESTAMLQTANITNGTNSLTWTPSASDSGKTYNLNVTTYNKDSSGNIVDNKYVENFTVTVASSTYEAELSSNTISGGAAVLNDSTCSGSKKVGLIGCGLGELTFNNVFSRSSGTKTLRIKYKTSAAATAYISVNGNAATAYQFTGLGNTTSVGTKDIQVSLNQGFNTIKFDNPNSSEMAPDIDCISII